MAFELDDRMADQGPLGTRFMRCERCGYVSVQWNMVMTCTRLNSGFEGPQEWSSFDCGGRLVLVTDQEAAHVAYKLGGLDALQGMR